MESQRVPHAVARRRGLTYDTYGGRGGKGRGGERAPSRAAKWGVGEGTTSLIHGSEATLMRLPIGRGLTEAMEQLAGSHYGLGVITR